MEKTPTHSSDSKGHQQFGFTGTPPGAGDLCNYSTEQWHSPHTQHQAEMYSGFLTGYPICWEYFFLHQSAFSLVTVVAGVCHKQASKRKKKCPRELQCLENRLSESCKAFVCLCSENKRIKPELSLLPDCRGAFSSKGVRSNK